MYRVMIISSITRFFSLHINSFSSTGHSKVAVDYVTNKSNTLQIIWADYILFILQKYFLESLSNPLSILFLRYMHLYTLTPPSFLNWEQKRFKIVSNPTVNILSEHRWYKKVSENRDNSLIEVIKYKTFLFPTVPLQWLCIFFFYCFFQSNSSFLGWMNFKEFPFLFVRKLLMSPLRFSSGLLSDCRQTPALLRVFKATWQHFLFAVFCIWHFRYLFPYMDMNIHKCGDDELFKEKEIFAFLWSLSLS